MGFFGIYEIFLDFGIFWDRKIKINGIL